MLPLLLALPAEDFLQGVMVPRHEKRVPVMATDLSSGVVEKLKTAAVGVLAGKAPPTPSSREGRLVSLDTFRGFIMFWIVGGRALVAGLLALKPNILSNALLMQLGHSVWAGLHFWDCIWPSFMLMVGVSIPLSYAKRSRTQTYPQMLRHAVMRFAILFLLGSLRGSIDDGAPEWIELSGVLQPIAIAYLVGFLLVRKPQWIQAAAGGAILAANVLIMAVFSAPGLPAGSYQETANIVRYVDLLTLGKTYLPGNTGGVGGSVLCIWFPIPTTILGMLIGGWLLSARSKASKMWLRLEPCRAGDLQAGNGFLRLGVGRMGLPHVFLVLLGRGRSRLPAMDAALRRNWQQRDFHLHVSQLCEFASRGEHLYARQGRNLGAPGASSRRPRGSGYPVAVAVLDVSKQNLYQDLSVTRTCFPRSASLRFF
ncbi:MAG: DUF1624 domain-containing protein, partial [Deltaproteobacteria bacterium]